MNVITYYGQFSLKEWIKLIISKNIIIPEYQRSFVWNEKDISRFIYSIKNGQFVPPVTIARDGDNNNLIIDGQQRLSAILLSKIGYFPIKEKWNNNYTREVNEDDSDDDNYEDNEKYNNDSNKQYIKWTFREIIDLCDSYEKMNDCINNNDNYKKIELKYPYNQDLMIDDSFFENSFLGFSYIVPAINISDEKNKIEIQGMYTQLFRNINYFGVRLLPDESRRSLYYLNENYVNYFDGKTDDGKDVFCGIGILEDFKRCRINIIRYLSILSQYVAKNKNINKVLVGYGAYKSREMFYSDYVSFIVGLEQEDRNDKFCGFNFNSYFPNENWKDKYVILKKEIEYIRKYMPLDRDNCFTSLIDADYWLFGMIYYIVFNNKRIINSNYDILKTELDAMITSRRKDSINYMRNSNRLHNLRNRIMESIDLWGKYVC